MKIFIGIVVIIVGTLAGYLFSDKYVKRRVFYENFEEFNKKLLNNISFTQDSLKKIVSESGEQKTDFYKKLYTKIIFKEKTLAEFKYLKKDESSFFSDYLDTIGTSDRDTQLKFLNTAAAKIDDYLKTAKSDEKKYRFMFIKLGFFFGLLAFILIL